MKAQLDKLRDRINALSLRERVLVFLAAAAVVAFLWNTLFMEPLSERQAQTETEIQDLRERISQANNAIAEMVRAREQDPDAEYRARLAELQSDLAELDERLDDLTGDLVEPVRMAGVLEQMLDRQSGLELRSLQALSARPLLDDDELSGVGNIYRHGVRMELTGSFSDTLAYLRVLEGLDSNLFWGRLKISMERYPDNRIVLVVHTLSLREGWIGV
ncbi:MSHA biogenesis protein MshJ [Natronospira proteinivora]|uniref:MSHA biogenesis protein MshJ n=1 Tax=Natronospira proteinivora TaxID=1807133 RepID=A0ABT1GAL8_9GAMM|nr:type II secretion system protein GspM [Natronospira proteinivora]MCP1728097.1 MSHA biogenesis protein MshJ [Natronospira proteinivora]